MSQRQLVLDGLDELESDILQIGEEVAYLSLIERNGDRDLQLARIDTRVSCLMAYLRDPHTASGHTSARVIGKVEEALEFDEGRSNPSLSQAELLRAACSWIGSMVGLNMVGETARRFRVRLYATKGSRVLLTGSFRATRVAENAPTDPIPTIPGPDPVPELPPTTPALPSKGTGTSLQPSF